jgi:hypothetical protein
VKRWLSFISLAVVGLVCGVAVGLLNTAFVPNCGEDCAAKRLGSGVLWGLALLMAFPVMGRFTFNKIGEGFRQTIGIAVLLSLTAIGPAVVIYGYELHQRYWKTTRQSEIPNVDFHMMAIATKPVSATVYGTNSKVNVKAWERCALGITTCDKRHHGVEAICLGSSSQTVLIDEGDWPAFQRIPGEDLPGISGQPKDMNLCFEK